MTKIKLKIHTWPENILKKKCRQVERVDAEIRELLNQMYELMRAYEGVGLAANQTGFDLRLVVVEVEDRVFKLVNPCIVKRKGALKLLEGCLSFPGLELEINRAKKIWVSAQDENGKQIVLELEDVLAVIVQHEIDHINGKAFIDRISFWQRSKIRSKLRKIAGGAKDGMCK